MPAWSAIKAVPYALFKSVSIVLRKLNLREYRKVNSYDAMSRAKAYIDAGADGIMIHSRKKDPSEIFEFCEKYQRIENRKPLVVVPSSFNQVTEDELQLKGVNIVIYANQLLRAAYPAMRKVAESILINHRSLECDSSLMKISEIL